MTEQSKPTKTCEYCGSVGPAFTFMDGETICKSCFSRYPVDGRKCRHRIHELEAELAVLRQQQGEPVTWWKHVPCMEFLPEHEHDAVKLAVEAIVSKLYKKYLEGYSGFEGASESWLNDLLHSHLEKGDPIDVANFCIFLFANGQRTREAAPRVPEGWKLVPVEPTEEMAKAYWAFNDRTDVVMADAWNAMLAAAPEPQPQADESDNIKDILSKT